MVTREICKATTRDGTPCRNPALPGTGYCHVHRGLAASPTSENLKPNPVERFKLGWQALLRRYWPLAAALGIFSLFLTVLQVYGTLTGKNLMAELTHSGPRMAGDFRIAVAGFAERGRSGKSEMGMDLARVVQRQLETTFEGLEQEMDLGFSVEIWGPDQVGTVRGQAADARAEAAADLARQIGADLLVYGWLDTTELMWQVTPEFYVSLESFYQAAEIAGQHDLGTPFSISGQDRLPARLQMRELFTSRAQALAQITTGLANISYRDFDRAFSVLEEADHLEGWRPEEGKEVLYLLMGYAAIKTDDLDRARTYYQRSLDIEGEYARAYIGLASVEYMRALLPFEASRKPSDIDSALLDGAIATYRRALSARNQPMLSDISTKVHFGLGQCYIAQIYAGQQGALDPAIAEFQAVIDDHAGGKNPRVRLLAAEAHGRLGLAYELGGRPQEAVTQYEAAASLLGDDPDRRAFFEQEARDLGGEVK